MVEQLAEGNLPLDYASTMCSVDLLVLDPWGLLISFLSLHHRLHMYCQRIRKHLRNYTSGFLQLPALALANFHRMRAAFYVREL